MLGGMQQKMMPGMMQTMMDVLQSQIDYNKDTDRK